jgi:hypothetical protein
MSELRAPVELAEDRPSIVMAHRCARRPSETGRGSKRIVALRRCDGLGVRGHCGASYNLLSG